jgi:hypothetical protein
VADKYTVWDEMYQWAQNESEAATYAIEEMGGLFENLTGEAYISENLAANEQIIACLVALLLL